jgi:hypothetical protein
MMVVVFSARHGLDDIPAVAFVVMVCGVVGWGCGLVVG